MTLRERSAASMLRDLDRIEEDVVAPAVDRAVRSFVDTVNTAANFGIREAPSTQSIVAALTPGAERVWPLTVGTLSSWWETFVNDFVIAAVRAAWRAGYGATSDGEETVSSLDNLDEYVARVSDRLVRGLVPPLPEFAMDLVRIAVTLAASFGWSNNELSARIAADLDWETDGAYWRSEYERFTVQIEAILDPLGPPGTPAREQARESDPRVALLQQQRTRARLALDNEQSYWQTRAQRIARTECFPPDAPVTSARVTAAYRRWFEGEMVTVTLEDGSQVSGTPNHPMLTGSGWAGLGSLAEGDHLIRDGFRVEDSGTPADLDVEQVPPTISQVFEAFQAVAVPSRERTAQPDFHGDGVDGYVDALRTDGVLLIGNFSPVTERRCQSILSPTDATAVARETYLSPFRRDLGIAERGRLLNGPVPNSGLIEDTEDLSLRDAVLTRQCECRRARLVPAEDHLGWQAAQSARVTRGAEAGECGVATATQDARLSNPFEDSVRGDAKALADDSGTEPAPVHLQRVVSVSRRDYSGHVFNLSTLDGYFTTGAYYTGNTTGAYNAAGLAALADEGEAEKVWIATEDARTRPSHAAADRQVQPLTAPFEVGTSALLIPGDPTGPPHETVNCRCTMVGASVLF